MDNTKDTLYLFVYGSLLRGLPQASFLSEPNRAVFVGEATIAAKLYDTGTFPALVMPDNRDAEQNSQVYGEVYRINEPSTVFPTLDTIEGYNQQHPERSLFLRRSCEARHGEQTLEVQVYVYNQSIEGMQSIESGSYREHITSQNREKLDD